MQFTLRQLKSQEIRLPEASRVRAFNDDVYEQEPTPEAGSGQVSSAAAFGQRAGEAATARSVHRAAEPAAEPSPAPVTGAVAEPGAKTNAAARQPRAKKKPAPGHTAAAEKPAATASGTMTRQEQAAATTSHESIFDNKQRFSRLESAIALSGFAIIAAALGWAWYSWDNDYALVGDADTAYNYGLTGGIMMLVILLYALRKRLPVMRRLGNITAWYYIHFTLGILAPVLIVLHTSFELRSVNATVAFIAMILVVSSGFLGRYIYTRASFGITYLEKALQSLREMDDGGIFDSKQAGMAELEQRIHGDADKLRRAPQSMRDAITAVCLARSRAMLIMRKHSGRLQHLVVDMASRELLTPAARDERYQQLSGRLRDYMRLTGNIALFQGFERLAAGWRLLHVPILYLLALSVAAHVVAVHMY